MILTRFKPVSMKKKSSSKEPLQKEIACGRIKTHEATFVTFLPNIREANVFTHVYDCVQESGKFRGGRVRSKVAGVGGTGPS